MYVRQDGGACPMLAEDIQNLIDISALLASGEELAIGVGPCPTFTKTIVRLGIYLMFARDTGNVGPSGVYVLSPLHDYRAEAQFYQTECGKQSAGACSDDNDLRPSLYVGIINTREFILWRHFVDEDPYAYVHINRALAGINAALQHSHAFDGACVQSLLTGNVLHDGLFVCRLLRKQAKLVFLNHSV